MQNTCLYSLGLIYIHIHIYTLTWPRQRHTSADCGPVFPSFPLRVLVFIACLTTNQATVALYIFLDSCTFVFFLPSFLPHCRSCYFTNVSSLITGCLTTLVSSCLYSLLRPVPFACAQSIRGYDLSLNQLLGCTSLAPLKNEG